MVQPGSVAVPLVAMTLLMLNANSLLAAQVLQEQSEDRRFTAPPPSDSSCNPPLVTEYAMMGTHHLMTNPGSALLLQTP